MVSLLIVHHCCTRSSLKVSSRVGKLSDCPNLKFPCRIASCTDNDEFTIITFQVGENKLTDVSEESTNVSYSSGGSVSG